jgi:hypothetical protein
MTALAQRATGWINVTSYDSKPRDETLPAISEINIVEEFTGDLIGIGTVRFHLFQPENGSAHFAGMERFVGVLGGRTGSFVFRNSGTLENGQVTAEWLVIPGSGTGDLTALRGKGGCTTAGGYFLDHWFE